MTPVTCLFAFLGSVIPAADGPKPRPAPIPERWLLRYAPKDMPPMPDVFAAKTWYHDWLPRFGRGWREWVAFSPESLTRPGTATITRHDADEDNKPWLAARTVPLAVHGRLVEYDGRLYTAGVGNWAFMQPTPVDVLDLGVAAELPGNVWYQAASQSAKGGPTWVQEWRMEFGDDPRTAKEGKVKVQGFLRETTSRDGEDFAGEFRFERTKQPHEKTWTVKLVAPEGAKVPQSGLPSLAHDPDRGRVFIFDQGTLNQMFPMLSATEKPAPKAAAGPAVGLMQPPKK